MRPTAANGTGSSGSSFGMDDVEKGIEATAPPDAIGAEKYADEEYDEKPLRTSRWRRWREAKSLNPVRWQPIPAVPEERTVSEEAHASLWSKATFSWMDEIMKVGYLRPLEPSDMPLVTPDRRAEVLTEKIQRAFERRRDSGNANPLLWALNDVFFRQFWFSGLCRLVADILNVINPFLLRYLIKFANRAYDATQAGTPGPPIGEGIGYAVGIALIQLLASITVSQFMYNSMLVGGQARAGLISMVFDKSLKISARAKAGGDAAAAVNMGQRSADAKKSKKPKEGDPAAEVQAGWSNGRVVNLMGTDTFRVDQAASWCHICWTSPVQVVLTLVLLLVNLSYSALAGFALLVLVLPLLSWIIKVLSRRRTGMNKITDNRVALMQEVLLGVRFVKFFGWEESFLLRLEKLRSREISAIQFLLGVRSGVNAVGMSLPVFASMLAFITYSVTSHNLDPASVFSSLALFNALRLPLNLLPLVIAQTIDAWVSLKRLQEYFLAEEMAEVVVHDPTREAAIELDGASFTWEEASPDKGSDDSGKSKGELKAEKKERKFQKRASKRESKNGSDPEKQGEEPSRPATADPSATPREVFTLDEINLAIARHELVAVVGSVGSGKSSLLAALAGDMRKTAGQVTMSAQLAYCPQYAWIQNTTVRENIVFGKEYNEEWYRKVVEACALQQDIDMLPDGDMTEIGERGITVSGGQKQRLNIARAIYFNADIILLDDPLSAVDAHVGKHLFDEAICGLLDGKCRILATHQLHVLDKVDRVVWMDEGHIAAVGTFQDLMQDNPEFAEMMSEIATDAKEEEKPAEEEDIEELEDKPKEKKPAGKGKGLMQAEERSVKSVPWKVYDAYIRASGSILVAPAIVLMLCASQAANIMSSLWLSDWISDKYHLTKGTYIGIFAALGVLQSLLLFAFAFTLTIAGTKSSRVLMARAMRQTLRAPMSFFDTTPMGRIINRFSKDVDVMDNNLTDSIRMYFQTLVMTLSVFVLIIVYFHYFAVALVPLALLFLFASSFYRASAREVKRHEAVLRSHVFSRFNEAISGTASIRAYGLQARFRTSIESAIDSMNGAYFITFANQRWLSMRLDAIGICLVFATSILVVTSRFQISPSISGVVLSYILQIVMMLQWMIRQLSEVENAMNSTERIYHYGYGLPAEAPLRTNIQLRPTWPERGEIVFENVQMRYRDGLPLVLKGLDVTIPAGARIGIVGRTGAGKSSITSALFRLVELCGGRITIDGVDIATLGLKDLRTKLSIIPQDPTLFRGTIRSNLDPFGEHDEPALLAALAQSSLSGAGINLDSPVEEEGLNFSLGQRQQMALARALVRGSRVVVADEATSSVDVETDRVIQKSMREGFGGRTVLCIAHRLRTILGYSYVVVMDAGRIVEFDTPRALWEREGGVFRSMCEKGGISAEDFGKID